MANELKKGFVPPANISGDEIRERSSRTMGLREIEIVERESIIRITSLEMEWDVGFVLYEPKEFKDVPSGPDARKIGVFLLHGGAEDHRAMAPIARTLASKLGYRVANMTYPGRLYLPDPTRDWPADTTNTDGSVRVPIWREGEMIDRGQYDVVNDTSMRARHGTRIGALAKPGTTFYERLASWPVAFENAMRTVCATAFPEDTWSIYANGHSTGGPFVHILSQRVANVVGIIGMETTSFGYIFRAQTGLDWTRPFNELAVNTWRIVAKYKGPEALFREGPAALERLPWLMEEVLEIWEARKSRPQFKAEHVVHFNAEESLELMARTVARRLRLTDRDADQLVSQYKSYGRELRGAGVKPVPPLLLALSRDSPDHRADVYKQVVLPMLARIEPAPRVALTEFGAGVHYYMEPEPDSPFGLVPAVADVWSEAIVNGFFLDRNFRRQNTSFRKADIVRV